VRIHEGTLIERGAVVEDDILSLDDDFEEDEADLTISQGVTDLTSSFENRLASILVISGPATGMMFRLQEGKPIFIGRAKNCDICLNEDGVSRTHARLDYDNQGNIILTDMDSTNGTYFMGERIHRRMLHDGDKIQVGSKSVVKFTYQDRIEEAFHQNQYEQAIRDGLTGAYNKRLFMSKLKEEFSFSARHAEATSLILLDIDNFKDINDNYGHPAGDMVLKNVAVVLDGVLREEDVCARYGGDEFAIILRNQDAQSALVVGERIRHAVELADFVWENDKIHITISMGVATMKSGNFREPGELLYEADEYLYKSKKAGRNRLTCSLSENSSDVPALRKTSQNTKA
jgi:diguanylate cyclase (GGDEF)-like protein